MLSRRDRAARNAHILGDLDCLTKTHWQDRLAFYSEKGYPTGSTGPGTNEINRPTERLALMPNTPPAARQARALEIEQALADLAREYHAIYQWTINAAKYDGPEPRACNNLECDREITMIGNDIARNGRCPRCAQHHRRHGLEYPHKP
jgi:hypothetical protein